MDKRRSSIRKSHHKDPTATPATASIASRSSRRISFHVKKSVREFRDEEDVQTWQASYEESDERSSNSQNSRSSEAKVLGENKENISIQAVQQPHNLQVESDAARPSLLSATMDYINTCQMNSLHVVNNSFDITLLESERNCMSSSKGNQQRLTNKTKFMSEDLCISEAEMSFEMPTTKPMLLQKQNTIIFQHDDIEMDTDLAVHFDANPTKAKEAQTLPSITAITQSQAVSASEPIAAVAPSNGGSVIKQTQSKGIIVRKVCTPISSSTAKTQAELQQKRLTRMKQKQQEASTTAGDTQQREEKKPAPSIKQPAVFQPRLSEVLNMSEDPLTSLLSPEQCDGISNLRELNDAIAKGSIQVYGNVLSATPIRPPKPPTDAGRQAVRGTPAPKKISSDKDCNDSLEMTFAGDSPLLLPVRVEKSKKHLPRYSQADEMLLNNTSYLTKAKLGDETASRNTSKCSTLPPSGNSQRTHNFSPGSISMEMAVLSDQEEEADPFQRPYVCKSLDFAVSQTGLKESKASMPVQLQLDATADFAQPLSQTLLFDEAPVDVTDACLALDATATEAPNRKATDKFARRQTLLASEDMQLDEEPQQSNAMESGIHALSLLEESHMPEAASQHPEKKLPHTVELDQPSKHTASANKSNMEEEEARVEIPKERSNRQTIFVHEAIEEESDSFARRQTLFIRQDIFETGDKENRSHQHPAELGIKRRQTLLVSEDMDECTEEPARAAPITTKTAYKTRRPTINVFEDIEMDASLAAQEQLSRAPLAGIEPYKTRPTIHFEAQQNDISMEESGEEHAHDDRPKTDRGSGGSGQGLLTPRTDRRWSPNYAFAVTPHRSIMEFEYLERQMEMEENADAKPDTAQPATFKSKQITLPAAPKSDKRSCNNLTPLQKFDKKRQTLCFNDCGLDESPLNRNVSLVASVERAAAIASRRSIYHQQCMQLDNSLTTASPKHDTGNDLNISFPMQMTPHAADPLLDLEASCKQEVQPDIAETKLEASTIRNISAQSHSSRIPVPIGSTHKKRPAAAVPQAARTVELNIADLNDTHEAIQLPRRILQVEQRELPDCKSPRLQETFKTELRYDDNTIIISDVSTFFATQRQSVAAEKLLDATSIEPPQTDDRPDREDTIAVIRNYLRLSDFEDIDKTRLSLVETLLTTAEGDEKAHSDDDEIDVKEIVEEQSFKSEASQAELPACAAYNANPNVVTNSSMCRKCRRCRESIANETTMVESFVLPPQPAYSMEPLERLQRYRQLIKLKDVDTYFERRSLELDRSKSPMLQVVEDALAVSVEEDAADIFLRQQRERLARFKLELAESYKAHAWRGTFVERLKQLLKSPASRYWIFDDKLQHSQRLIFHHRRIVVAAIELRYVEVTPRGDAIKVLAVKLNEHVVPLDNWRPIDYVMHFQLQLELFPLHLRPAAGVAERHSEQAVYEMLQQANEVFVRVHEMAMELWRIVSQAQAALIRDAGYTYVRKVVRRVVRATDDAYARVECHEFRINILNIPKLSFNNIIMPRLHVFREDIQLMPTGLEFLRTFLQQPMSYLRDDN